MSENDGHQIWPGATLMNEMNAKAIYLGPEVRETIEHGFLRSPVIPFAPVLHQLFKIRPVRTIVPTGAGNVIGPAGPGQTVTQIIERRLRNAYLERLGTHLSILHGEITGRVYPGPCPIRPHK